MIGERSPDELCDYGIKGNGVMRHVDAPYDNVVFVGGFSKAYSSLLAFIALPTKLKNVLKVLAPPYLYSGPSPVASLATALTGLEVNRTRGDAYPVRAVAQDAPGAGRARRHGHLHAERVRLPDHRDPLANHEEIDNVGRYLFDHGIYATMAAYPLVPKNEVGFRIQTTAANTDEQIEDLIRVLGSMQDHFQMQDEHISA